jgi:CheY-like chemotaxis protein
MSGNTTIYIADDDEDDRMLLRDALEAIMPKVRFIECDNGADLLHRVAGESDTNHSALILMDMNMPKVDGLEALANIRSNESTAHIPIIMLSTASYPDLVKKAYHRGINAYMSKPVDPEGYTQIAQAVSGCFLNDFTFMQQRAVINNQNRKRNILVIEDNADHSKLINYALSESLPHVNVIGMEDRTSTMDFLANQWPSLDYAPDLILLDLYLPDRRDGLNLLESIKRFLLDAQQPGVPVIVVSHSNDANDIAECYRQRANAYMVKKASDLQSWIQYYSHLCHFWMDTIVVPEAA